MSGTEQYRRFVVLLDGEEVPVEVRLSEDGALRYSVGDAKGSAHVAMMGGN